MKTSKKLLSLFMALTLAAASTAISKPGEAAVSLSNAKVTMQAGSTVTLTLKGAKGKQKWSSSKPSVATVTKKGKIKAKKAGKTIIKVKISKKTFKCNVTVFGAAVLSATAAPKTVTTAKPAATATVAPAATALPLSVNWTASSSNAAKLRSYVSKVTDKSNANYYIPVQDRIAVFDMDGTLMCETYPTYYDTTMFADYCINVSPAGISEKVMNIAKDVYGKTAVSSRSLPAGS